MIRWFDVPYAWIAGAGAIVWAALIVMLANTVNSEHMIFRIILLIIAIALSVKILSSPSRAPILSPLYLLGLIALVFYSLLPAVYVRFPETFGVAPNVHKMTMAYPGGTAELLIMQFAVMCFALVAACCHFQRGAAPWPVEGGTEARWRPVIPVAVGMTVVAVAIFVAKRHVAPVGEFLSAGVGRQILDAQGPLLSFCLATLAYAATSRVRALVFLVMAVLVLVGLTATGLGRMTIFILLSPLALMVAVGRVGPKALLGLSGVAISVIFVSIMSMGILRQNFPIDGRSFGPAAVLDVVRIQVVSKLIARQSVSGWCLDRVARNHLNSDNQGNPFFFITAVFPRLFWPDKPNLSRGSEYAEKYCGMIIDPNSLHSESLTLLGEPVINAGARGIAVAQVFLAGMLLGAMVLALRTGALGVISLTAMLPWLTQFEQHFALYSANAVKMYLFMTPLVAAWLVLGRMTERRAMNHPAGPVGS